MSRLLLLMAGRRLPTPRERRILNEFAFVLGVCGLVLLAAGTVHIFQTASLRP